jgi:hypothetical protein
LFFPLKTHTHLPTSSLHIAQPLGLQRRLQSTLRACLLVVTHGHIAQSVVDTDGRRQQTRSNSEYYSIHGCLWCPVLMVAHFSRNVMDIDTTAFSIFDWCAMLTTGGGEGIPSDGYREDGKRQPDPKAYSSPYHGALQNRIRPSADDQGRRQAVRERRSTFYENGTNSLRYVHMTSVYMLHGMERFAAL